MFSVSSLFTRKQNKQSAIAQQVTVIQVDPVERLLALRDYHLARRDHYRALWQAGYSDWTVVGKWNHSVKAIGKIDAQINAYAPSAPQYVQQSLF